jgi:hypothetical protein
MNMSRLHRPDPYRTLPYRKVIKIEEDPYSLEYILTLRCSHQVVLNVFELEDSEYQGWAFPHIQCEECAV